MTKSAISEIQQAITSPSRSDYAQLRRWLNEYDWEDWDRQIEADSDDGKLGFLVAQTTEAGRLPRSRSDLAEAQRLDRAPPKALTFLY